MEKAMLSIVDSFDEFWSMLLLSDISAFTFHKKLDLWHLENSMCSQLANKGGRISPMLHYIEDPHNLA